MFRLSLQLLLLLHAALNHLIQMFCLQLLWAMRIPATTTAATSNGNGNKRRNNNIPVPAPMSAWPGLAWLGLASTISCPCKLFVDNFVCYKSPRASVRTIQASPEANSSAPFAPRQCCSSPLAVSVQQSVKERAVTIHKTEEGEGTEDGAGRSVFWALLNCRSNDCKWLEFESGFGFILAP